MEVSLGEGKMYSLSGHSLGGGGMYSIRNILLRNGNAKV